MTRRGWLRVLGALVLAVVASRLWAAWSEASDAFASVLVGVPATARVEYLLGPADFTGMGGDAGPELDVAPDGAVVIRAGATLRLVDGAHRTRPIALADGAPESFALDHDGAMLAVQNGYFGLLDDTDHVSQGVPLPKLTWRMAPSSHPGAVYLFGGSEQEGVWRLYRFLDDGGLQVLLASAEPIVDVADDGGEVYVATPDHVLRLEAGTPERLFEVPDGDFGGPVRGVAAADGMVFFSTATSVYALLGPNAIAVVTDAGGALRARDGALTVLDPVRHVLFRLRPASAALFAPVLRP